MNNPSGASELISTDIITNKALKCEGTEHLVIKQDEPDIMIVACFPPAKNMNSYRAPDSSSPVPCFNQDISSPEFSSEYVSAYLSNQAKEDAYFPSPPNDFDTADSHFRSIFSQASLPDKFDPSHSRSGSSAKPENVSKQTDPTTSTKVDTKNSLPRHVDVEFHRRLHVFVKNKKSLIVRHLTDEEKPQLCTRSNNDDFYGVSPTLEFFFKPDIKDGEREFFANVRCGDVVIAQVATKTIEGLYLNVLCYDGNKRGGLEDLRIDGYCSHDERIPANPNDLNQVYVERDLVRCEVLKINLSQRRLSLGMKGKTLSPEIKRLFPLGLITTDEDLPRQYLISNGTEINEHRKGTTYEEIIRESKGFHNPGNVEFLGATLGLFSNYHSLMTGLGFSYPKKDMADELRKAQNLKWAETYVKLGKQQFLCGNQKEAFSCLSKAIAHDNKNVNYLVLRGALFAGGNMFALLSHLFALSNMRRYAVAGRFRKATEDLETAMKAKPESTSIKKCIAESFLTAGKGLQDNGLVEDAINSYTNCLEVLPDSSAALNILMNVQRQTDELDSTSISGVMAVKFAELRRKLEDMLSDEISKESTGQLDKIESYLNMDCAIISKSLGPKRKKECKTKTFPSSSTSSSASSGSDCEEFLALKRFKSSRSKVEVVTDYQKIEEQVNAFMAKCDKGKPNSILLDRAIEEQTIDNVELEFNNYFVPTADSAGSVHVKNDPCQKKSMEKVTLPSKIILNMDKYGNYLLPKGTETKTFQREKMDKKQISESIVDTVPVPDPDSTKAQNLNFEQENEKKESSEGKYSRHTGDDKSKWSSRRSHTSSSSSSRGSISGSRRSSLPRSCRSSISSSRHHSSSSRRHSYKSRYRSPKSRRSTPKSRRSTPKSRRRSSKSRRRSSSSSRRSSISSSCSSFSRPRRSSIVRSSRNSISRARRRSFSRSRSRSFSSSRCSSSSRSRYSYFTRSRGSSFSSSRRSSFSRSSFSRSVRSSFSRSRRSSFSRSGRSSFSSSRQSSVSRTRRRSFSRTRRSSSASTLSSSRSRTPRGFKHDDIRSKSRRRSRLRSPVSRTSSRSPSKSTCSKYSRKRSSSRSRQPSPPSKADRGSPKYSHEQPSPKCHLPLEEFGDHGRNPVSFQLKTTAKPKRVQTSNTAVFVQTSSNSTSGSLRSSSPTLTNISVNTDASGFMD